MILRGNHESAQLTAFFNFKEECTNKYDLETYLLFTESFNTLPIACVLNSKFLVVHGGISPELNLVFKNKQVGDINNFNRFMDTPKSGLFCDLLWSDPVDNETGYQEKDFVYNETRGCSYYFGYFHY